MAETKPNAAKKAAVKTTAKTTGSKSGPKHAALRDKKNLKWLVIVLAVMLVLAVLVPVFGMLYGTWLKDDSSEAQAAPTAQNIEDDPPPVISTGSSVWRVQANKMAAEPEYAAFMASVNGVTLQMADAFATVEETTGTTLQKVLPAGTWVVNSGSGGNGWYTLEQPLKTDRWALTDPAGEPKVLVSCGNPVRLTTPRTVPAPSPSAPINIYNNLEQHQEQQQTVIVNPQQPVPEQPVVSPPPGAPAPVPEDCDGDPVPDTGFDPSPEEPKIPPGTEPVPPGPNESGPGPKPA